MSLKAEREALIALPDLRGVEFCRAYAAAADEWLTQLLTAAVGDGGDFDGLALVAAGGYGRGELAPHSDLDLVLVHRSRRDVERIADALWYPVWDQGVRLDHSVRTPAEVLKMAGEDLRVQLGLLDGRLVAGDDDVAAPLLARAKEMWRTNGAQWLPVLGAQVADRHRQYGDVAFLLEPDLKEAHGGLRDVDALRAVLGGFRGLGQQVDVRAAEGGREVLVGARVELHRRAGRALDRLLLQEQDAVAAALGYGEDRGADALMADIAAAGRAIAWSSDHAWRRAAGPRRPAGRRTAGGGRSPTLPWRRRGGGGNGTGARGATGGPVEATVEPVEDGIAISRYGGGLDGGGVADNDESRLGSEVVLIGDPVPDLLLALRVATVAAERDVPIARDALEVLGSAPSPTDPWPPELRDALVRVLLAGPPAVSALESLDHHGLLVRLLPEWATVRNRPQRNAYHRFTVDRHLLEAAAGAAALGGRVARPDILGVGALLHDLGKGSPGDHTDAGIELVRVVGPRMGFGPDDVAMLEQLVRHHLLLPDVATRRDIEDPLTVQAVASAVGDRATLDLLAALTEADSLATGPAAWGTWKAGLVSELVRRTASVLEGGELPPPTVRVVDDAGRALMARLRVAAGDASGAAGGAGAGEAVLLVAEQPRVTVVAEDRPGLFATVAGVLALHGLNVRSADVAGEDGVALEVFTVDARRGRWPDWEAVEQDLAAAIGGRLPVAQRLARQSEAYDGGRRPASSHPATTQVNFDNAASEVSTVVEVRAIDSLGLLHRVTTALFECDLDVVAARISTLGHEVVDAFYVRHRRSGTKVEELAELRRVESTLRVAIDGATLEPDGPADRQN